MFGLLLFENQNFLLALCFNKVRDEDRRHNDHYNTTNDDEYPPINAKDFLSLVCLTVVGARNELEREGVIASEAQVVLFEVEHRRVVVHCLAVEVSARGQVRQFSERQLEVDVDLAESPHGFVVHLAPRVIDQVVVELPHVASRVEEQIHLVGVRDDNRLIARWETERPHCKLADTRVRVEIQAIGAIRHIGAGISVELYRRGQTGLDRVV